MTHFDIAEDDMNIPLHVLFGDRPHPNYQSKPATNVYVHVNPDQADHMLVDPAYKLEKLKEGHERLEALVRTMQRVEKESNIHFSMPVVTSKTLYSNWFEIEKSIRRLDRIFLKVEKFQARQFIDAENHDRREQRMLARKRDRWTDNYTYFFGGLTEEEQMYRDYFQTDIEEDPEDTRQEEFMDELNISQMGEFSFDKYEFVETSLMDQAHDSLIDVIDKKLFKFKYRLNNDGIDTYLRRMNKVVKRQLGRAKNRDPSIEINLDELLERSNREESFGVQVYNLTHNVSFNEESVDQTDTIRQYMVDESLLQYKDYFETDEEEHEFFEYMEELPHRDRIRFIELYQDFTIPIKDNKGMAKIPKREYNSELSYFSNVALDLIDFKDRVRPLAEDAARLDSSYRYQRSPADEVANNVKLSRDNMIKFLESQGETPIDYQGHKDLDFSEELLSSEDHSDHSKHYAIESTEEEDNKGEIDVEQAEAMANKDYTQDEKGMQNKFDTYDAEDEKEEVTFDEATKEKKN